MISGPAAGFRDNARDHHTANRRPLFGLRRRPGRLALTIFRLPLSAYRHNAGPAAGRTFVAFTHIGRKTGQPHETVAMVLRDDRVAREVVICAGWGPQTDWYRNLQTHPAAKVQLGGSTFGAEARFLSDEEAFDVIASFRRDHPLRVRFFTAALDWGNFSDDEQVREFIRTHPFVGFRPASG